MSHKERLNAELLLLKRKYMGLVNKTPMNKPLEAFPEVMKCKREIETLESMLK